MRTQRTTAGTAIAASLVVALASVVIPPASAAPIPFHTAPSSATNADRSTEAPSGRIVWTRVSEEGSFLMTSRADGLDSRVLTQHNPQGFWTSTPTSLLTVRWSSSTAKEKKGWR